MSFADIIKKRESELQVENMQKAIDWTRFSESVDREIHKTRDLVLEIHSEFTQRSLRPLDLVEQTFQYTQGRLVGVDTLISARGYVVPGTHPVTVSVADDGRIWVPIVVVADAIGMDPPRTEGWWPLDWQPLRELAHEKAYWAARDARWRVRPGRDAARLGLSPAPHIRVLMHSLIGAGWTDSRTDPEEPQLAFIWDDYSIPLRERLSLTAAHHLARGNA